MDGILHLSEGAQECLTSLSACAVLLGDVSPAGMLPAITLLQINAQKAEDVEVGTFIVR